MDDPGLRRLTLPLEQEVVESLRAGDRVLLSGTLLAFRDAAHKRLVELVEQGLPLPVDLHGQLVYYAGPSPARPGRLVGAFGPTTSGRMDAYSVVLIEQGLKGMMGKGYRSPAVREAMRRHGAVYLAAVGGAGALLAARVKAVRVVAYEDLGPEAIRQLEVEDFPAIVINDVQGGDLYEEGRRRFERRG